MSASPDWRGGAAVETHRDQLLMPTPRVDAICGMSPASASDAQPNASQRVNLLMLCRRLSRDGAAAKWAWRLIAHRRLIALARRDARKP